MSADIIADLVGAMRAAVTAVLVEEAHRTRSCGGPVMRGFDRAERRMLVGEYFLDGWSTPPLRRERPSGRIAHRCRPLSELEAAGWRILPVPMLYETAELLGPRMGWYGPLTWIVIPPEGGELRARTFKGPGKAQIWASECQAAIAGDASAGAS